MAMFALAFDVGKTAQTVDQAVDPASVVDGHRDAHFRRRHDVHRRS